MRAAASRTFWTAGRRRPMRIAMMAITTNSSINVKPRRSVGGERRGMPKLLELLNTTLGESLPLWWPLDEYSYDYASVRGERLGEPGNGACHIGQLGRGG